MKSWLTPQQVEMLSEVIDMAIELTDADFGNIQMLDTESRLKIIAHRNFPDWWLEYWDVVEERQGACGTALANGDRVIIEDIELSPIFADTMSLGIQLRAGIRAVQSTPLRDKAGNPIGMFSTHYRRSYRPDLKTLKILDLLATHAASLIQQAQNTQALIANEVLLRQALNAADAGTWKVNLATGEMIASERTLALHGVKPGSPLTHAQALTYHYAEDREQIDAAVRHTAETGEPFCMELRVLTTDDSIRWIASYGERHYENDQPCIIGLVQDITERKQFELQLEASETHYRSVVQDQTEVICRVLPDGTFTFVNDVFCRLFGKTSQQFIGQCWQPIAYPDDVPMIEAKLSEMSPDNPVINMVNRNYLVDGEIAWMQWVNRGIYDADGLLKEIQVVGRDVTPLKQAEMALSKSEERLEMALTASGRILWDWDLTTDTVFTGSGLLDMLGYSSHELGNKSDALFGLIHPQDLEKAQQLVAAHLAGDTASYQNEHRLRHKDGHWVWIETRGRITERDAQGTPLRMVGTLLDITQRKRLSNEGFDLLKRVEQLISEIGSHSRMAASGSMVSPLAAPSNTPLSRRNRQILQGIAEGKTTVQMAVELGISEETAKTHRRNLMRKLGLNNKAELIRYAIKEKIVKI